MPQFSYVAVNKQGARQKGTVEAPTEAEVRVILRSQQLRPIRISKAGMADLDIAKLGGFTKSVSELDVLWFTRQLAILLGSGIPLVQGLDIIGNQTNSAGLKSVVMAMKEKIMGGAFLWESMKPYNEAFPDIYVSMVRAGEAAGALDVILKRLITYIDNSYKLKKMVKGAMIYPIAVVLISIIVVGIMMVFVIPKFEELLKSGGQEMPGPTQFVLDVSHFMQANIGYIIAGLFGVTYFIKQYLKTAEGRSFYDFYVLKVPLFGPLLLKVAVARFARTMQTLLSSGINLLDAMDICKDAIGNKTIGETLVKMRGDVEQGKTLATCMAKAPLFPSMVVQMVTVGESTGGLDKMLEKVADFYEEDVQNLISNLTKMIEPFMLVFLGGLVGGLMIAMYLPIFKMAGGAGA